MYYKINNKLLIHKQKKGICVLQQIITINQGTEQKESKLTLFTA